jgi:hypothetical protein
MTATISAPAPDEAAEYFHKYINQVGPGDVRDLLEAQATGMLSLLGGISDERSRHRYAPDKWTIRQVMSHVNDTERVFTFRALWFARGFAGPLPSFDQDVAIAGAAADDRPWPDHVEEFRTIRAATITLFRGLQPDMWDRRGIASNNPVSVRALAYIVAGHVTHHEKILRERYL